ncbi:MAG: RNA methyltransferase [Planctomycetota bacterium]
MSWHELDSIDAPELEPFREVRSRNLTEQSGYFIAEGPILVQELLASDYDCQSLLVGAKHRDRFDALEYSKSTNVYCLPEALVEKLVGFPFHRGIMGCGLRKPRQSLDDSRIRNKLKIGVGETITGLEGIHDPENLGGIIRSCAALGIQRVLLGPGCADPFSRRALRVAMGTTMRVELLHSEALDNLLPELKAEHNLTSFAASLSSETVPLKHMTRSGPVIVLFGNEKRGISDETLKKVDHQICIDMHLGVDSLNVNVAAGIVLHYFTEILEFKD